LIMRARVAKRVRDDGAGIAPRGAILRRGH